MPTKKKATQKQKQKQSQVVNIHIGDKGGKKKRRPRVIRQIPKQPIVVNVSTPQMSIPSFENRTFLDGAKFSSSVPINELAPAIRTNDELAPAIRTNVNEFIPTPIIDSDFVKQKRMEYLVKQKRNEYLKKFTEGGGGGGVVPVEAKNFIDIPSSFSSISLPPESPFSYISSVSSVSSTPISSVPSTPILSVPSTPISFIDSYREIENDLQMFMEDMNSKKSNDMFNQEKERNYKNNLQMGMEDINSRLQNDMFNQEKERNLMDKEDVNVPDIEYLKEKMVKKKPRRTNEELTEAFNMGLEDPNAPLTSLSKWNKIELRKVAEYMGIELNDENGKVRTKSQLVEKIEQGVKVIKKKLNKIKKSKITI